MIPAFCCRHATTALLSRRNNRKGSKGLRESHGLGLTALARPGTRLATRGAGAGVARAARRSRTPTEVT
jgi:hypothetical protein